MNTATVLYVPRVRGIPTHTPGSSCYCNLMSNTPLHWQLGVLSERSAVSPTSPAAFDPDSRAVRDLRMLVGAHLRVHERPAHAHLLPSISYIKMLAVCSLLQVPAGWWSFRRNMRIDPQPRCPRPSLTTNMTFDGSRTLEQELVGKMSQNRCVYLKHPRQ